MGHLFWKQDPFFSLENHIRLQKLRDETTLNKLHEEFINQPWKKDQSPWEVILVPGKIKTFLFLRVHHSLADGKSLIKIIVEGLGQKKLSDAKPIYPQVSPWKNAQNLILMGVDYIRAKMFLCLEVAPEAKKHPWISKEHFTDPLKTWVALTPPISLSELKRISTKTDVYTSSVIFSILSAVMSRFLSKRCGQFVTYPFPRANHPEDLTNHFTIGIFKLPLGDMGALTRLKICDGVLHEQKHSQLPKYIEFILEQPGVFPKSVKKLVTPHNNCLTPIAITNMSADQEGFQIGGFECSNISVSAGVYHGRGVRFMAIGYKDQLQFSVSANSSVFNETQAQKLATQIYEEFTALQAETLI